MFKRKIYDKMLEWKRSSNGRTALLVEGARRVGKSTVVRAFAEAEYESHILIDFAFASRSIKELFDDMSDLNYFFLQLQLQLNTTLHKRKSVIIFDEVQHCPRARQAIKVLVQDGRYDYIETGSLISIKKNVANILIPSEERRIEMFPMDYEEFRWALGDRTTIPLCQSAFEAGQKLGDATTRKLMRDFRLYMLVGGMPQAVSRYIEANNFAEVDQVKRDILVLYEDDFRKIDASGRMSMLFGAIPAMLNSGATRYQVSSVVKGARADGISETLSDMLSSKTVLISHHVNDPNVGLSASRNLAKFKLFLADTGLFTTQLFKDADFTENDIYARLLNDKLGANLGFLYENVVAQILTAKGYELFYHSWHDERAKRSYEVDFILPDGQKISPIEVKSSTSRRHRSLDEFSGRFSSCICRKYIFHAKDRMKDGDIVGIPFFMAASCRLRTEARGGQSPVSHSQDPSSDYCITRAGQSM